MQSGGVQRIDVDDPADPRLADYVRLTDMQLRRVLEPVGGLFLAEGEKVVRRAVGAGYGVRSVLLAGKWLPGLADLLEPLDVPVYVGPDDVIEQVTGFAVHRGALASMQRRPLPSPAELLGTARHVAVLEGFTNPTNVGAVFRAAAALGLDAVLLDPLCADPLYRRSVRVSMGAALTLPYARFACWPQGLADIRAAGLTLLALTPAPDAVDLDRLTAEDTRRCAVVLGAEGPGLAVATMASCDRRVRIPMARGVDSLNVAAAAAVAFWQVTRHADRPAGGAVDEG
jgi:tRNA G18 (ribose-2'-O)-methylase SpoU